LVLSVAMDEQQVEAALAAGRLACPDCTGPLGRWGFAREREVRMLDGVRSCAPRRARCGRCEATHVLSPAWSVPRRRDGAEVIGEALRQAAVGGGHRTIARRLGRPPGTVRGWLRAARGQSEQLRCCGTRWAHALDPQLGAIAPAGSPLADAVQALAIAARAWVLRLGQVACPWELIVWLTDGLLCGRPRDPP
jgi:hypothetical protein